MMRQNTSLGTYIYLWTTHVRLWSPWRHVLNLNLFFINLFIRLSICINLSRPQRDIPNYVRPSYSFGAQGILAYLEVIQLMNI